ncbi:MAG: sigma-70 family RNA polymerase sigma factor [Clostridia bacterium]|nr:sigma-70 family RNA polymerase sigma factor [Clostridia bacterium]
MNMPYDDFSNEELLEKYHKKPTVELRNEIYKRYANVAQAVARKYVGRGIEYEDILQVARMSLLKSIERFDIERGVKLQSFATPTIIGEIKNYFRAYGNSVKISRRSLGDITKIKLIANELSVDLGRQPTVAEIASRADMSEEYVLEMLDVMENSNSTSLDTVYSSENAYTLGELVGNFDKGYDSVDIKDSIKRALDVLSEKERYIIVQRYYKNKSQREVADILDVSQMYISRAERKIFEKLRHRL